MLLITSDWHIDCSSSRVKADSEWALNQLMTVADEIDAHGIIAAGDIIDHRRPDSYTMHLLDAFTKSYKKPIYFVQGQHEYSDPPWMELLGWKHLHFREIELGGSVSVVGLDYCHTSLVTEFAANLPPADIVVVHQPWSDFLSASVYPPIQSFLDKLSFTPNLLITGDYHVSKSLWKHRSGKPVRVLSPGCLFSIDVNVMGYPAVHIYNPYTNDLKEVKLHCRNKIVIDGIEENTEEEAINAVENDLTTTHCELSIDGRYKKLEIPSEIRRPYVLIRCTASDSQNAVLLSSKLRSMGAYVKVTRKSKRANFEVSEHAGHLENINLESLIKRSIDDKNRASWVIRFLHAKDVKEEVKRWWKEHTGEDLDG